MKINNRLLLLVLLSGACTHRPPVKAADPVPLPRPPVVREKLLNDDEEIVNAVIEKRGVKHVFATDFKKGDCSFGKVPVKDDQQAAVYNVGPATFCTAGKRNYFASFPDAWSHYEWTHATLVPGSKTMMATLDYVIEGGMQSVPVFRSTNGGKSWQHMGDLEKPHFAARVVEFTFSSANEGHARIEWDDTKNYFADTKDGGKSWSAPYLAR